MPPVEGWESLCGVGRQVWYHVPWLESSWGVRVFVRTSCLPPGMALRAFFLRLRFISDAPLHGLYPRAWMLSSEEVMAARGHVSKKLLAMNRFKPGLAGDLLCNALRMTATL